MAWTFVLLEDFFPRHPERLNLAAGLMKRWQLWAWQLPELQSGATQRWRRRLRCLWILVVPYHTYGGQYLHHFSSHKTSIFFYYLCLLLKNSSFAFFESWRIESFDKKKNISKGTNCCIRPKLSVEVTLLSFSNRKHYAYRGWFVLFAWEKEVRRLGEMTLPSLRVRCRLKKQPISAHAAQDILI